MDDRSAYRQKLEARLEQWRAKQQEARRRLDELDKASGEAWKDLKSGLEAAWAELGRTAKKVTERFS